MLRVLCLLILAFAQQGGALDIDKVLERADKLLEDAKTAYESAREKGAVAGFVDAGFKLEEARIKYLVLQEIGGPEKQKTATDRLRAVNQLAKLIHDGKVAVSGAGVGDPATKPSDPAPAPDPSKPDVKPDAPADKPAPSARVRLPVPEAAKQKEAERLIKDLFKEPYSKKAPADRQQLARLLLGQAAKTNDDPAAAWVMYREAQDIAVQICDLRTAKGAIEGVAAAFDVDVMALKYTAFGSAAKNARTPEDYGALTRELLLLVDDLVAADQYDVADKAAASALLHARKANDVPLAARATGRTKEVAEAKTSFLAMKGALETLARNPEDPAANSAMGQMLCFIKGNWELGVRFLVKGSDAALKGLAEKELAQPQDQTAIADGWWEMSEKEKSPLRKSQMQLHARDYYETALPGLSTLARLKVEKRLESLASSGGGGVVDLLHLIDIGKDTVAGTWTLKGDALVSDGTEGSRIECPYEPPAEYDFKIVFIRNEGVLDVFQSLSKNGRSFLWTMSSGPHYGFGDYKGRWVAFDDCQGGVILSSGIVNGKTHTAVVQVRKDGVKGFLDGKLIKELKDPYADLQPHDGLRLRKDTVLGVGSYRSPTSFLKIEVLEIGGKGKKLR
jgi:hypothetical protein